MFFFGNFSEPGLIFGDPEEIESTVDEPAPAFRATRITYFAVWEPHDDDKAKRVELAVEAECVLDVVAGIDVENPHDIDDETVAEQIRECRNMFNFQVKEFEYDDDEALEHGWTAEFTQG